MTDEEKTALKAQKKADKEAKKQKILAKMEAKKAQWIEQIQEKTGWTDERAEAFYR